MRRIDEIICDDSKNLGNHVEKNTVALSIVIPPYTNLKNYYKESSNLQNKKGSTNETANYLNIIDTIIDEITKVTKPGGICCLILTEDKDPESGLMIPIASAIISKIVSNPSLRSNWSFSDTIFWVKSPKDIIDSSNSMGYEGMMVNFGQTPFSKIYILVKNGLDLEYMNRLQRIEELHLAENKKEELAESMWFVQPKSEKGYTDRLPKEIVLRLIMIYSNEGDLVLDPFSRDGITAVIAKGLNRKFLCIDKNPDRIQKARKRIQSSKSRINS